LHLGRTDDAIAALDKARAQDSSLLQVQAIGINIELQRFRDAQVANEGVDAAQLVDLAERTLELRERFLAMARYREAARALMMASDAAALAGRRSDVPSILGRATDDERRLAMGDHVLAEAALRALRPETALQLLWGERPDDPERTRIVGQAVSLSEDPHERAHGLELLDRVVALGGDQGEAAAATRLIRCLHDSSNEWSDKAEALLAANQDYRWLVRDSKALWLAGNDRWTEAEALLIGARDDSDAREALLQVYWLARQDDKGAELALEILESGTQDQALRVKCALALRRVRDFRRVRAELSTVARDTRAGDDVRQFAFTVWFDDTEPEPPVPRFEILELWRDAFPDDPNLAVAWQRMDSRLRD
jgi:hypothetical protein